MSQTENVHACVPPYTAAEPHQDLSADPPLSLHQDEVPAEQKSDAPATDLEKQFMDKKEQDDLWGLNAMEENHRHLETGAIDQAYARKVYLLNKIINEHIGMRWWQWGLLVVSGLGWLIDNAWLQLVAIIQNQVQFEFAKDNNDKDFHPEFMTLALFAGLFVGALFWGFAADIVGRRFSFNATLLIAGIFGIASGSSRDFVTLCSLLAVLGVGLGGALPVDGMLFLEFLPGRAQSLLTLLSVFWPLGQLVSSLIGWGFIGRWGCEDVKCAKMGPSGLDTKEGGWLTHNVGWRYLIFTTGAYTLAAFFVRFVIFQIPESPKFLLSKNRDADAVLSMHRFAKICGKPLPEGMLTVATLRAAAGEDVNMDEENMAVIPKKTDVIGNLKLSLYNLKRNAINSHSSSPVMHLKALYSNFWLGYTSTVIWACWALIGLAYPLFNSFILIYLKNANGDQPFDKIYRNYVIVSVCGVPGSILGMFLVELPRSGRRGGMAIGTLLTGIFLFGYTGIDTPDGVLGFQCVIMFTQMIMYGVLYCYTPESFPAPLRGTSDGIASSLNRLFGLFAPIIKIYGSDPDDKQSALVPIYVSAALFIVSGLLMLTLRIETAARTAL